MIDRLKHIAKQILCHRHLYTSLCGCHLWAAIATHKPEVYLPMALLYLLLSRAG